MILGSHPSGRLSGKRALGYWYSDQDSDLPDPRDFVSDSWSADERAVVVEYLDAVSVAIRWRGLSRCRICGTSTGSTCISDNSYAWPEGLSHYVREHGVRPPSAFVDHAVARISDERVRRPATAHVLVSDRSEPGVSLWKTDFTDGEFEAFVIARPGDLWDRSSLAGRFSGIHDLIDHLNKRIYHWVDLDAERQRVGISCPSGASVTPPAAYLDQFPAFQADGLEVQVLGGSKPLTWRPGTSASELEALVDEVSGRLDPETLVGQVEPFRRHIVADHLYTLNLGPDEDGLVSPRSFPAVPAAS